MKVPVAATMLVVALGACTPGPNTEMARTPSVVPHEAPAAGPTGRLAWARRDGRLISGSSDLTAEARANIAECSADSPPFRTAEGIPGEACMEERGYYVRELVANP